MDQITARMQGPDGTELYGPFLNMEVETRLLKDAGWSQIDRTTFAHGPYTCTFEEGTVHDKIAFRGKISELKESERRSSQAA